MEILSHLIRLFIDCFIKFKHPAIGRIFSAFNCPGTNSINLCQSQGREEGGFL